MLVLLYVFLRSTEHLMLSNPMPTFLHFLENQAINLWLSPESTGFCFLSNFLRTLKGFIV